MLLETAGVGRARKENQLTLSERRARNRSLCSVLCTPPPYPGFSAWMGSLSQLRVEDIHAAESEFALGPPPEFMRSMSAVSYSPSLSLSVSLNESPRPKTSTQSSPPLVSPDDFDLNSDDRPSKCTINSFHPSASSGYGSASSESEHETNGDLLSVESPLDGSRRIRNGRYKTAAEREADKYRRRSVPATLRNAYSEDVIRVLEQDGHLRFETDVKPPPLINNFQDTGIRMPVLDMRVRQHEGVLELARKYAEKSAAQERAMHKPSAYKPSIILSKSGPSTPIKQDADTLKPLPPQRKKSILKSGNPNSDQSAKESERKPTVVPINPNQRRKSSLKPATNPQTVNSSAEKVVAHKPTIVPNRNAPSTVDHQRSPSMMRKSDDHLSSPPPTRKVTINAPPPQSDRKASFDTSKLKRQYSMEQFKAQNNQTSTVEFKPKPPRSVESPRKSIAETVPDLPKMRNKPRQNRPMTMDPNQLEKMHKEAMESVKKNENAEIVRVELPEKLEDIQKAIDQWKNVDAIPKKTPVEKETTAKPLGNNSWVNLRKVSSARPNVGGIAALGDKPLNRMAAQPVNPWKQMAKGGGSVVRPTNPQSIKEALLRWVQSKIKDYPVDVTNFSSSWCDGMAFCALIHRFAPDSFDFGKLDRNNRRYNFDLAFKVAEDNGICPLLEVDDMILMGDRPDWKCVFTYVQCFYKEFRNRP